MTSSRLVVASACHSIGVVIILVTFTTIICQMKKLRVPSAVDIKKEGAVALDKNNFLCNLITLC
jgi:hypothetical protein